MREESCIQHTPGSYSLKLYHDDVRVFDRDHNMAAVLSALIQASEAEETTEAFGPWVKLRPSELVDLCVNMYSESDIRIRLDALRYYGIISIDPWEIGGVNLYRVNMGRVNQLRDGVAVLPCRGYRPKRMMSRRPR